MCVFIIIAIYVCMIVQNEVMQSPQTGTKEICFIAKSSPFKAVSPLSVT